MPTTTPRWFELAKAELGTREMPGSGNAPKVVQYYQDAVEQRQADSVPWCAAFVGSMLVRGGEVSSGSLMARSYLAWGEKDNAPSRGTVVVFGRAGSKFLGHVAFFDKDNGDGTIMVLGGNQSDAVTLARRKKKDVLGYRWPKNYAIPMPPETPKVPAEIVTAAKKMMRGPKGDKAMPSMTTQEIMAKSKELYEAVDTTYSIGAVKKQAKTAATLIFYMAQNMLPPGEAKATKGGLPKPRPAAKAKKKGKR